MSKHSSRTTNSSNETRRLCHKGPTLVQRRGGVDEANPTTNGSQEAVATGDGSALRIIVEPTTSGRKWIARLGERVLCIAAAPFIQSARILFSVGYHPDAVIEMWRPNTKEWALRGRVGPIAATLMDGETAACAKNRSPAREDARAKVPADNTRSPLGGPFLAQNRRSSDRLMGRSK
jgi:hypothetical protein